ncbi:MAG: imidazole glycerol phosphate synthase subunit HisF [Gemmatimonadaceae bacterium]
MLARRIVVCLDVDGRRVVKGVRFADLRDVGEPATLAAAYEAQGADELVFLDISASAEARETVFEVVRDTAQGLFIPLTLGGGLRCSADIERALRAGADKVSVNTAAVERPQLLDEAARTFGAQCVVASIDAVSEPGGWRVVTHGGRVPTRLDAVEWARECVARGAGEILLTSVDRDGARRGYDLELTLAVSRAVSTPVIASGGAGSAADLIDAMQLGEADAVLVAGILHDGTTTVANLKNALHAAGIVVRRAA